MLILSKCRYIIDPNSTIVELMLNHSRTFEKLEVFGRYRTRRTDTALVAPNTPRAGATSGLHRPLGCLEYFAEGYLGCRERYLSSEFDIGRITRVTQFSEWSIMLIPKLWYFKETKFY